MLRWHIAFLGACITAVAAHGQETIAPDESVAVPVGHSFVIGIGFDPAQELHGTPDGTGTFLDAGSLELYTMAESYERRIDSTAGSPSLEPNGYSKTFDVSQLNLFMSPQSLIAIAPPTSGVYEYPQRNYVISGFITQNHAIVYQPPASILANVQIGSETQLPTGLIIGNPGASNGMAGIYYTSTGGAGVAPAIYYSPTLIPTYTTAWPYPYAQPPAWTQTAFANTGAGAISSQASALAFGPDGALNVLDVGADKILRYNAVTLQFISSFSLADANTDPHALAITSGGDVFTADLNGGGDIYDYATGRLLATFGPGTIAADSRSQGGYASITADAAGDAYVYEDTGGMEGIEIFSAGSLSAVPEPAADAAIICAIALGFSLVRRRVGRASRG